MLKFVQDSLQASLLEPLQLSLKSFQLQKVSFSYFLILEQQTYFILGVYNVIFFERQGGNDPMYPLENLY